MVHEVQQWSDQRSETEKGLPAQMRLLYDLYVGGIRQQHPGRDLQTLSGSIHNGDRSVSPFGFADDLKVKAAEWVERIDNTNVLSFCA
jgi:hypothetical protein